CRDRVISDTGAFETSTLVDADINDDRIWFHPANGFIGNNAGAPAVTGSDRSNGYIAIADRLLQHYRLDYRGKNPGTYIILKPAKPVNRAVKDFHFSAERNGGSCSILADSSRSQDHNFGGGNAGNSAKH